MRKVKCALRPCSTFSKRMTGFCREHGHDSLRVLKEKMDLVEIANVFTRSYLEDSKWTQFCTEGRAQHLTEAQECAVSAMLDLSWTCRGKQGQSTLVPSLNATQSCWRDWTLVCLAIRTRQWCCEGSQSWQQCRQGNVHSEGVLDWGSDCREHLWGGISCSCSWSRFCALTFSIFYFSNCFP